MEQKSSALAKGDRVRIKTSGKRGVVVGTLAGFGLVRLDGANRDFGYHWSELQLELEDRAVERQP